MDPLSAYDTTLIGQQHRSLEAVVCDALRNRIVSGELAPGLRLVESSLAEDLAVSRAPVREAIRRLEHEGFVTISPRRGATVAEVSKSEALDCYEIREALEAIAHRLAARRRTAADLRTMREILASGDALVAAERWADLASANTAFHASVVMASGNAELAALLGRYHRRITWIFSKSAHASGAEAWAEHSAIAGAIEARDEVLAESLVARHLSHSRTRYLREIDPPAA